MLGAVIFWAFKLFVGVIGLTLLYYAFICVKYFRHLKFSWNAYGFFLPILPFIGNTYVALFTGRKVNMLATLLWGETYFGVPINFWFGHKYHYICGDAEESRIILNHPKCLSKAQLYDDVQYVFRSSLLLITAEKWKPRRRYLRTAFKTNMLKSFFPTFYQQSCLLIDQIRTKNDQESLFEFFNKYSFMNFFLTSAGLDGQNIDPNIARWGELIDRAQDEFVKLLANPAIPAFIWMRIPPGAKLRKLLREMKWLLKEILLKKKQQRAEVAEYVENPTEVSLVDLILAEGYEKERESDIFEEFTLFAGAATDTTGHTLAFCFTLLGMYPEAQKQVYEEVESVIGDGIIDSVNIQNLKYTEAVISESLRILPSVPLFGRYCSEDIDVGTKVVPKGASFFISAYHIHRSPEYWPDPLKFDPSRFSAENMSKIVPGSYVPFSAGPRNCIGQSMAMILMKLTVANVIRHYQITSNHKSVNEFVLESCISMKTEDPLDCHFIPRINEDK